VIVCRSLSEKFIHAIGASPFGAIAITVEEDFEKTSLQEIRLEDKNTDTS